MAIHTKDAAGRVALDNADNIVGVILETTILNGSVKVRPTNTTAWINTAAGTGTVDDVERNQPKLILLYNGPKGGFTQGGVINDTSTVARYLVSENVRAVVTDETA